MERVYSLSDMLEVLLQPEEQEQSLVVTHITLTHQLEIQHLPQVNYMPLGTQKTALLGAAGASNTFDIEILIVAGGGGGAYFQGGGGGAGGIVHDEDYAVAIGGIEYDLTVGTLGAAATVSGTGYYPHTGSDGSDGADSVWNVNAEGGGITMTAVGGGGGGSQDGTTTGMPPKNGGSAGGTGAYNTTAATSTQTSPTGAVGYGNNGGKQPAGIYQGEAGGGGAGGVGQDGSSGNGGNGGAGREFSNFSSFGVAGFFGGGGAGGTYNAGEGGTGGSGGGGTNGGAGTANTGGVGAGGRRSAAPGAGGTGVILIRYAGSPAASGGTETESGGYTYHAYTSTGSATFTTD